MAGGGVCGKDVGIVRVTTIRVGDIIEAFHLFMQVYPQAGGMTTEIIVGEAISGTTNEYPTSKFNKIGGAGRKTNIGKSNKLGVSKG